MNNGNNNSMSNSFSGYSLQQSQTTSIDYTNVSYSLSLRLERPIADCELTSHPFLSLKGGNLDNLTRGKYMDANPHYFTYRWSRGPLHPACANSGCPRRQTYEPQYWTRHARGGPGLRCAVCEKIHIPKYESFFCSVTCFQVAWKMHTTSKHNAPIVVAPSTENFDQLDDSSPVLDSSSIVFEEEKVSWTELCSDKVYVPSEQDVGYVLKLEVSAYAISDNSLLSGPAIVYTEPVLAAPKPPNKRQLLTIPGASTGTSNAISRFRVVSYNILSELYATKQAYPYCDSWSLTWPYRRKMILQELEETQGDILCLQEVQADHYENHLKPFLQELGYDGMFKQKSRESMGQYGKVDGCATFWRQSKFVLTENYVVDFNESATQTALNMGLDENECRKYINRLSKDNIAQVLLFEVINSRNSVPQMNRPMRQLICVANTHLYSNHQRPDVKLWQTMTLMTEIERIVVPRDIPLVLCGDFNSEPDSAVYELLVRGEIQSHRPEIEERDDALRILPDLHHILHSLELTSAMSAANGIEPLFTNYTGKFKGCLDYIIYSPSRLRVLAIAAVPQEKDLERECGEGLPSATYPSDHIKLCCDMALLNVSNGTPNGGGSTSITRQLSREQQQYLQLMGNGNLGLRKMRR